MANKIPVWIWIVGIIVILLIIKPQTGTQSIQPFTDAPDTINILQGGIIQGAETAPSWSGRPTEKRSLMSLLMGFITTTTPTVTSTCTKKDTYSAQTYTAGTSKCDTVGGTGDVMIWKATAGAQAGNYIFAEAWKKISSSDNLCWQNYYTKDLTFTYTTYGYTCTSTDPILEEKTCLTSTKTACVYPSSTSCVYKNPTFTYESQCLALLKLSNGASCSMNAQCSSGNCVHWYCRSSSPYCGDGFCDSGEICTSDCGITPTPSCTEGANRCNVNAPETYVNGQWQPKIAPASCPAGKECYMISGLAGCRDITFLQKSSASYSITGNKITVMGTLTNPTTSKVSGIVSLEVQEKVPLQAVFTPTTELCDPKHKEDVHGTFSLEAGESVPFKLESFVDHTGDYEIAVIAVDKCCLNPDGSYADCKLIPEPVGWGSGNNWGIILTIQPVHIIVSTTVCTSKCSKDQTICDTLYKTQLCENVDSCWKWGTSLICANNCNPDTGKCFAEGEGTACISAATCPPGWDCVSGKCFSGGTKVVPPEEVRCGDGSCSDTEGCHNCAADCVCIQGTIEGKCDWNLFTNNKGTCSFPPTVCATEGTTPSEGQNCCAGLTPTKEGGIFGLFAKTVCKAPTNEIDKTLCSWGIVPPGFKCNLNEECKPFSTAAAQMWDIAPGYLGKTLTAATAWVVFDLTGLTEAIMKSQGKTWCNNKVTGTPAIYCRQTSDCPPQKVNEKTGALEKANYECIAERCVEPSFWASIAKLLGVSEGTAQIIVIAGGAFLLLMIILMAGRRKT